MATSPVPPDRRSCPLVFACSGCSNAGATADQVARELDRRGIGQMSCLAGVAAGKPNFHKQLRHREVWLIDGCPIACAQGVFDNTPAKKINRLAAVRLDKAGLSKNGPLPDIAQLEFLLQYAIDTAQSCNRESPRELR